MVKESSLAPKERINVTFRPATGGAQEEIELPLKVMVTGDFLQRYDARPLTERKPVSVNKNNFADVLAKQNLSLQLTVRNRLTDREDPDDLPVNLSFESLRDFEPEGVARQIPEMNSLHQTPGSADFAQRAFGQHTRLPKRTGGSAARRQSAQTNHAGAATFRRRTGKALVRSASCGFPGPHILPRQWERQKRRGTRGRSRTAIKGTLLPRSMRNEPGTGICGTKHGFVTA